MTRISLYFDEDALERGLVTALRARRVEVLTAFEADMINRSDEDHLACARRNGCVLYSFNIADYCRLHSMWLSEGNTHAGIVVAYQQRYSVGEQLRRLLILVNRRSAAEMIGRLEYLSAWKV